MKSRRWAVVATAVTVGAATLSALPAGATGSVAGGNKATGEVGSALASCTEWLGNTTAKLQSDIYRGVPGKGAVLGQAYYFANKREELARLLEDGMSGEDIINAYAAANATNDPTPNVAHPELYEQGGRSLAVSRQYLVSSLNGPSGAWTGSNHTSAAVPPKFKDALADDDDFTGVVGGNTLTSTELVDRLGTGFRAEDADVIERLETVLGEPISDADAATIRKGDLAERLFLGLSKGFGQPGEGDARCVYDTLAPPPAGSPIPAHTRSSSQGWIRVDSLDGVAMNLTFASKYYQDAIVGLARMYKECRLGTKPCVRDIDDNQAKIEPKTYGIDGTALALRSSKRSLSVDGRGVNLTKFAGDPTKDTTTVEIKIDAPGTDADRNLTYTIPASGWSTSPLRWSYKDVRNLNGPISSIKLLTKTGKLEIETRNIAWNLGVKPDVVDVVFRSGEYAYCMHFTGGRLYTNKQYRVTRSPAPANCT